MRFSLLYTSRRSGAVRRVVDLWLSRANEPVNVEFVFTADQDDRETAKAMLECVRRIRGAHAKGPYPAPVPGSCVKGWNLAARYSTGEWLIAISDDFEPPEGWDTALAAFIYAQPGIMLPWTSRDGAVMVNDGIHDPAKCLQTLGIISRGRYERLGYICHPAYTSMFDDTERGQHALQDGVMMIAPDLVFKHHHYVNGERAADGVDAVHGSPERFHNGRRIYEARKALGFPIDAGPNARIGTPDTDPEFIAYVLAVDPYFCLPEVCERLRAKNVRAFYFSVPTEFWNGQPVPRIVFDQIEELAGVLTEAGCQCWIQMVCNWPEYRNGVVNYSDVEGRVRNAAMDNIREIGFRHVLIVDSDELWRNDLVNDLRSLIASDDPPAYVSCHCIPVVAGYPVEGATDIVGIYMDAERNRFMAGRSTYYPGPTLKRPAIFHLTATRESFEALVAKMRSSAHYDDPDYEFEKWLFRVPRFKPGSRDVHMYAPGKNVWPLLRHWTMGERDEFPPNLRQYLRP